MAQTRLEVPVRGMDCAECTVHVQHALAALPGVEDVRLLLSSEKAVLQVDPTKVDLPTFRKAVEGAGYTVTESTLEEGTERTSKSLSTFTRPILTLFGLVFGAVLLIGIVGEWLGLFERVTEWVPWYIGWGLVLLAGFPQRQQAIAFHVLDFALFPAQKSIQRFTTLSSGRLLAL